MDFRVDPHTQFDSHIFMVQCEAIASLGLHDASAVLPWPAAAGRPTPRIKSLSLYKEIRP